MTLPFRIDSHVWMFVLPVLAVMLWALTRPPGHSLKLLWLACLARLRSFYRKLFERGRADKCTRWVKSFMPRVAWAAFWALAVLAFLSFLFWVGLLK